MFSSRGASSQPFFGQSVPFLPWHAFYLELELERSISVIPATISRSPATDLDPKESCVGEPVLGVRVQDARVRRHLQQQPSKHACYVKSELDYSAVLRHVHGSLSFVANQVKKTRTPRSEEERKKAVKGRGRTCSNSNDKCQ